MARAGWQTCRMRATPRTRALLSIFSALSIGPLAGCGDDAAPAPTTDATAADATSADVADSAGTATDAAIVDATVATDATLADTTDGATAADATLDETSGDATAATDATLGDTSDGAATDDATDDVTDPADTALVDTTEPDATVPLGDNVFSEGSFERWSAGLPIGWMGDATNLTSDAVAEDATSAHDGLRACRLTNASGTHKRFTTAPQALEAGRYQCTYWVHGEGEIRNARYTGDYSSYSSYTTVADAAWREVAYDFSLVADAPAFELVFSVRNTGADGLVLDDVSCRREARACDVISCESWQVCDEATAACITAPDACADAGDCEAWQICGADHHCALAPGACERTVDCGGGATPVCDLATHGCVAGDPCAGVTCAEWQVCDPTDSGCDVAAGRCESLADCTGALPVCDRASHTCLAIDAAVNVVPNGGFEGWSDYQLGGGTFLLPDAWYGLDDGTGSYFPETEIAASNVRPFEASPHGGVRACELVDPTPPAERFTTEPFAVASGATYDCAYWVRGHGDVRHRGYCGAWGPDTTFMAVDSDAWQQVRFELGGASTRCVIILYASGTVADRDHIQLDDVVCVRRP